ncbi:MAG: hypothetical protein HN348_19080 [Proteobacteria bacterium]|nr:hypothetical protein [Pseudomonadota bacterium]
MWDLGVPRTALGEDWEGPLATAIGADPLVKRDYGPVETQNWRPPTRDQVFPPLPTGARFYLDGVLITLEPQLGSIHVLQRRMEEVWETRLLRDEPFPAEWLSRKTAKAQTPRKPLDLSAWSTLSVVGGFGLQSQSLDQPGDFLAKLNTGGLVAGVGTFGVFSITRHIGLTWDATLPLQVGRGVAADTYGGLAITFGEAHIVVGAGATSIMVDEGGQNHSFVFAQPHLGGGGTLTISRHTALNLGLAGGGWPSTLHLQGYAKVLGVSPKWVNWMAGPEFSFTRSIFVERATEQDTATPRQVAANRLRIGLRIGVVFGKPWHKRAKVVQQ